MKNIQILGTGCAKCNALTQNVKQAVEEAGLDAHIEKVEDLREIIKFGVMVTPALVVDGQVKVAGRAPGVDEIKKLIV
jgi:small redox-active disulfide protein 2